MDFADACYECGVGDNEDQLLVCDKCDYKICHISCCGLTSIPSGDWICKSCKEAEKIERKKKYKRRRYYKRIHKMNKKNKKRRRRNKDKKKKASRFSLGPHEEEKSEVEF